MLNWDHWTVRALASSRKAERSEKDRKIWNDFSRKSVAEILGFSMQAKRACVSVNAAHHFCSVCVVFSCFFWPSSRKLPWPLTFWTKMGTPVTPAMGNFFTNCCFYMPLRFRVKIPCWTDRQTDGRTDGRMGKTRNTAWVIATGKCEHEYRFYLATSTSIATNFSHLVLLSILEVTPTNY